MENKKILITGGAGFIGSHLVDSLVKQKNKIIIIDDLSTGKRENLNPGAVFYNIDICDPKIKEIFEKEKPEIVFHLAAQISVRKSVDIPLDDARINILGSINVFENAKKYKTRKIIFTSTGGVMYGNADVIPTPESHPARPLCPYGICKLSVEHYLDYYQKVFGLSYAVLRLGNVYGPRQDKNGEAGVVAIFCGKMLAKKNCTIYGDGKQTRDYVYVQDIITALESVAEIGRSGVYNIGTGTETDVNTIHSRLARLTDCDIKPIYGPAKSGDHRRGSLDATKARRELKWKLEYDMERGLLKTIEWFKNKF